jgi:hypothetical protein
MLPDGLFSFLAMPNTKRKKRLTDDGVQIIWYTILVWVLLFVLYILGFVFRPW